MQSSRADVHVEKKDGLVLVHLSGIIDETFDIRIAEKLDLSEAVVLNLKGVVRINSMGMLLWRTFMSSLSACSNLSVVECSTPMIEQTSMIADFMGRATILSACVPYVCPECQTYAERVLKTSALDLVSMPRCETCGTPMVLDVPRELYLDLPEKNLPEDRDAASAPRRLNSEQARST